MSLLCVAPGCAIPRHHLPDPPTGHDENLCRGCLPARAEYGLLCTRCYSRLRGWLGEIPDLYAEVVDPPTVVDSRTWVRTWETLLVLDAHTETCAGESCRGCLPLDEVAEPGTYRVRRQSWTQTLPADPVAVPTPAGLVLAGGHAPRVSGSREPGVPARLNEAGPGTTTLRPDRAGRLWVDDQVGEPPAVVILDLWARDWQHLRGDTETLPVPTTPALCGWLLARLEWAAQHHPAIDECYAEIRSLHSRLFAAAGHHEAQPEHCQAVPCKSDRCNQLNLWRRADGTGDVDCHTCGRIYQAAEYSAWSALAASLSKPVHVETRALVEWLHVALGGCCPTCHQSATVDRVLLAEPPSGATVRADLLLACGCPRSDPIPVVLARRPKRPHGWRAEDELDEYQSARLATTA